MDRLLELLENTVPGVDFANGENLVTDGYLNSISMVTIIVALQDEYDVEFDLDEMTRSNFESLDAIRKMLARYTEA